MGVCRGVDLVICAAIPIKHLRKSKISKKGGNETKLPLDVLLPGATPGRFLGFGLGTLTGANAELLQELTPRRKRKALVSVRRMATPYSVPVHITSTGEI